MRIDRIRNFSIIAHIDHGKSTLADRLLLLTGAITRREFRDQILDDMDLERERGITIKSSAVNIRYTLDDVEYSLNLIDTPGHVDFSYEVSRSLAACEGALLLVDASQGVEAQTMANAYQAINHNIQIIPVISKIDLPAAHPDEVTEEMEHLIGVSGDDVLKVSAKTGEGVTEVLRAIVERVPAPTGRPDRAVRALIFDSVFDEFRGVITYVRMVDGTLHTGDRIRMLQTHTEYEVTELGCWRPRMTAVDELPAGEVGYIIANIKTLSDVRIGDTVTRAETPDVQALAGYKEPQPMVFCGFFPADRYDVNDLRRALEQLALNDCSFTFEPETSDALGFGFRCGFLGLLHMEIVQERLEREGSVEVIQTAPSVTYEIRTHTGDVFQVRNPSHVPPAGEIEEFREPIVRVSFVLPAESIGSLMKLCQNARGTYIRTEYLSPTRVVLVYDLPFAEIVFDFYDRLKSITRGYGTMDYEFLSFEPADLVKLDILVASQPVDALSSICHRDKAYYKGRALVRKLRKEISRHLFEVPIQAAIGSQVIARETIAPLRKNVTAKCYGGDVTRKRKLLEKQKEGKKRMKQVGRVSIPQKAFLAVLGAGEEDTAK
ncbi:MAG TPA: translation elongation factor 4 [Planctomycetota bacterium]|nr:translation elongation factor 4 [Planctomycetota bacterium]